jgi:riboflavin synthase
MFTGIVETTGCIRGIRNSKGKTQLEIRAPFAIRSDLKIGASVAVSGVCLTAVRKTRGSIFFDLAEETKRRSTLGRLRAGDRVNLERPLKWSGRLEGHFVLGHVDGVGKIKKIVSSPKEKSFLVAYPARLGPFILEKGSIAVDGVSLTIGRVTPRAFRVHLVPHTLKATQFGNFKPGTTVNLETDVLLKFFRTMR